METSSHEGDPEQVDTAVPHCARVWDYWLGGEDNFTADREVGEQVARRYPQIVTAARDSRGFLCRAVRFLAAEVGIRQFLDIGTGLPTADNTHHIAQRYAQDARVVYVDNDPLVLTQVRSMLSNPPDGAVHYLDEDVRHPARVLARAREHLDFGRPVALMLVGIMGHVADYLEGREIVDHLMSALPSGSYLALYDGTDTDPAGTDAVQQYNRTSPVPYTARSPGQIRGFFDGLDPVEPGLVPPRQWRPETVDESPGWKDGICGVARKP